MCLVHYILNISILKRPDLTIKPESLFLLVLKESQKLSWLSILMNPNLIACDFDFDFNFKRVKQNGGVESVT